MQAGVITLYCCLSITTGGHGIAMQLCTDRQGWLILMSTCLACWEIEIKAQLRSCASPHRLHVLADTSPKNAVAITAFFSVVVRRRTN